MKILVLETDLEILQLNLGALQRRGHETVGASNVPQAMSVLVTDTAIDIVLLNQDPFDVTGDVLSLSLVIAKRWPRVAVIFASIGYESEYLQARAFLQRPYSLDELEAAINRAVLQGESAG